uniref:hypothetical protein n=1 Tax=Endozoicomonas sp. ONNA1 TaxID=2828740 RepID=UPI0021476EEB
VNSAIEAKENRQYRKQKIGMKPGMKGVTPFPRWREFCDTLFTAGRMSKEVLSKSWPVLWCAQVIVLSKCFIRIMWVRANE